MSPLFSYKSFKWVLLNLINCSICRPLAAIAALEVLYDTPAQHRIAILGSMNELGDFSKQAHQQVANFCQPSKLDLVITIGQESMDYLAPLVHAKGIKTRSFMNPSRAGQYLLDQIQADTVILAKGSQNGVYAEEAIKQLLRDPLDSQKLVRQSKYWMSQKAALLLLG